MPSSLKPKKTQFQSLTGANTRVPSILQPQQGGFQSLRQPQKPNFQLATGESITAPKPNLESLRATGAQAASMSRPAGTAVLPPAPRTVPKLTPNEQTLTQQRFTTPSGATGTIGELQALGGNQPRDLPLPVALPQPTVAQTTPQPIQPQPIKPQPSQLAALQQQLQGTFAPTPEEIALQQQLNNLLSSEEMGINQVRNQPIAMPFITGQAAAIQRQAATQATPLQRQLALLQAQRIGQREALQSQLEFEQSQQPETFNVGGNLVRINPKTGQAQTVFSAPTDGQEPIKVGDQLVQLNPQTGRYESVFGGGDSASGELSGVTTAVMQNPQAFKDLTPTIQGQVLEELGSAGIDASPLFPDPAQANAARAAFTVVRDGTTALDKMVNDPTFFDARGNAKSGTFAAGLRAAQSKIPGTNEYEIQRLIQSVRDNIGIDALLNIKREGSGLGQVPQQQLVTLQGLLGRLEITRDPELLKRDIQDVMTMYQEVLDKSGNEITQLMRPEAFQQDPETAPDGTEFELDGQVYIKQGNQMFPKSFNKVEGDTNQALNRPQRNNNPGNVKAGGLADSLAVGTDEQGHLIFPSAEAGFQALQQDLQAKISGNSRVVGANPTIAELGAVYAEDPNWANKIAQILGVDVNTRTASVDFNSLIQAIARQEGFYA